ncbi:MAG: sugar ABC transporter permease [Phycisphaerales bacterium]|nr:sugar ABC transporter permease [Planctomycetota bacterium]MCH8507701.1 sugar ABC transporter permease [Phycisphaerales bacterium]
MSAGRGIGGPSHRAAWIFLAPFALVTLVFVAYPLVQSAVLAVQQTYGPGTKTFVGTKNFTDMSGDPVFWTALRNTIIYTLGSLFIQLPLALALALALNSPRLRGRGIYRLIFFSPQLMGLVFVSILAALMFEKQAGLVNQSLHAITGGLWSLDFPWLESHVMATLIIISLWMYVGFNMIYFLAALQNVDQTLIEASEIDGAGVLARFRHVVIPAIRPVGSFVIMLSMIGSLQLFELPFVLLEGTGGPRNQGLTVVMYLYQSGFEVGDLGYASAIGWVLAVLLIGLAIVQLWIIRREER